jgi:catechol 2,3-dioxygenase-like lactoylglutathione lyase family enzyme
MDFNFRQREDYTKRNWLKTGIGFGIMMFILLQIVVPLLKKIPLTMESLSAGFGIAMLAGLLYGLTLYFFYKFKGTNGYSSNRTLNKIAIVVKDYDEAIDFYTNRLGFQLVEDTKLSENKRLVVVAPLGSECSLLLAKAANSQQQTRIGNQTGGRVFLFMYTDNIDKDYEKLMKENIKIVRKPTVEEYGKVLVFEDLYGNLWDLIQAK